MNIHVLLYNLTNILFKTLKVDGVTPIDFLLFRNLFVVIVNTILLYKKQINPIKSVPNHLRFWLGMRVLVGLTCSICFTFCIGLLPLSLLMIIIQTCPFWTSVLGYFLNHEMLQRFEIIGMVIAFMGVLAISFSKPT
jgi:drug/metabolite transporter (DMT)-like permease